MTDCLKGGGGKDETTLEIKDFWLGWEEDEWEEADADEEETLAE